MSNWPLRSLLRGIRTTRWPAQEEQAPGITPGRPQPNAGGSPDEANHCPTGALKTTQSGTAVNFGQCIHCQRCRYGDHPISWHETFDWTSRPEQTRGSLGPEFRRSLHVRYLDAGACGGCMGEVRLIDAPPYNLHRLGIFITPTPRDADVLLVAGPVTESMRDAVRKTYEAMPNPKRVVAMGICAINGGIFGTSFASAGGLGGVIPIDLAIPGCPPPPLAIIHGLLAITGRTKTHPLNEAP